VYLLAEDSGFALIWYTGYGFTTGNFEGGQLLSRDPRRKISARTKILFEKSLRQANLAKILTLDDFCVNEGC
jgi:hypothetical protein